MEEVLNKEINDLDLNYKIIKKLKQNDINLIIDLWKLTRNNLKMILTDKEINEVIIKLQLKGLDLNKRIYKYI